jgi:HlyD family secretion protein
MNKRIVFLISVPIAAVVLILVSRNLIQAPSELYGIRTAKVDYGQVAMSVPATGIVNPENEVLLLSPASSLISEIHTAPGSKVSKGDIILSLDPKGIRQDIDNLKDQLNLMENDLQKNRLNAKSTRVDLDYNADVKKLRINSLKSEITDQEQLLKVGGLSPAALEQTKQELVLAEKDLKMIQEKNSIRLKQLEADEQGLQLQIDVRRKELEGKLKLLDLLNIKAPSNGIVLNIYGNVGERVDKDKLLAKMSDLSTYKVKCSIDEKLSDNVKTGGEAYAIIDNVRLKGKIANVSPVINDRKINFDVFLDYNCFRKLIPNLEVEIVVITHQKDSVLRIERGPAFNKNKQQDVFVVRDGKAVRQRISTGLIGTFYMEILSGLKPGDQVITSDISGFRHKKEVALKNQ